MQSKTVRVLVILLLTILNIGLLIYYVQDRLEKTRLSPKDVARITSFYEDAGITFDTTIPTKNLTYRSWLLKDEDLDEAVLSFLGSEVYNKTYIYGAKVQYTAGNIMMVADWQRHSISYTDAALSEETSGTEPERIIFEPALTISERGMLEQVGRTFAARWLGEDLHLSQWKQSGQKLYLEFHPLRDGVILHFNTVEMEVTKEGIVWASIVLWRVDSEQETLVTMSIDEVLFEELKEIRQDLNENPDRSADEVTMILTGYEIESQEEEKAIAVPNLTVVLKSGMQYTVRLSGENLQKK